VRNLRTYRVAGNAGLAVSAAAFAGAALVVSPAGSAQPAVPPVIAVQGVQQIPAGVAAPVSVLPSGFGWRVVRHQVADCAPGRQGPHHWAVVVWRGPGDMQSALFCPGGKWGNGLVWTS